MEWQHLEDAIKLWKYNGAENHAGRLIGRRKKGNII